ncbi:ATP-binding protein [Streptomyces lycii]|uniref:ATP-binding protein n=1 Tax=Streptomyces lycii TaxID=2654337 RepID=A0ABQ7FIN1_9ACTN|nr:ATP-binding protein [Streptomyces lycii]
MAHAVVRTSLPVPGRKCTSPGQRGKATDSLRFPITPPLRVRISRPESTPLHQESPVPAQSWPPGGGLRGVPHTYTLFCPPLPTAPRIARDYVATVLRSLDLHRLADDAALCASEVVTNAFRHGGGCGSLLLLTAGSGEVRVTVYDSDPEHPVAGAAGREADGEAESGRGLYILDALTEGKWGTEPGAPPWLGGADGKGVWFVLTVGGGPGPLPGRTDPAPDAPPGADPGSGS